MPAPTTIVINDGATTPVAHTFTPIGKDAKGVLWYEQTTPIPNTLIEAKRIGYKQYRGDPMSKQLNIAGKVVFTLHVPKAETLGNGDSGLMPAPTLAYKEVARIEFDLPERSATQERKDTRVLAANLLANAMAVSAIDNLQPTYGG
jgi:hypothetical protein